MFGLLFSIVSILGVSLGELYLAMLEKKHNHKTNDRNKLAAYMFAMTSLIILIVVVDKVVPGNLKQDFALAIFIPIWNFSTYLLLNFKRTKIALGK